MNSLLWDMYVIQRKFEFYINMYPKFYYYRFRLFMNDLLNRKIYFRNPLPDLAHFGQVKELNKLSKLDPLMRIRYLRFHTSEWYWKWKISFLSDYSGETGEMQQFYDEVDDALLYLTKYYLDLWQEQEEIYEALITEKFN
ncbi:MAG: hypothetical protein Q7T50_08515 [Candidatus Magasanikbacteria bacterium]|nr:hypothetical protein [Candidatus Magasanikbacteria bacterium]